MINKTTSSKTTIPNDTEDITLPRMIAFLFDSGTKGMILVDTETIDVVDLSKVEFVFIIVPVKRGDMCTKLVVGSCCVAVGEISW